MPNLIGGTAYDTIFPGALLRLTFVKASFLHSADTFYVESQHVFDKLSSVAHLYHQQNLPLVRGATTWTVDARNQAERRIGDVVNEIAAACDIPGLDVVKLDTLSVLTPEAVRASTGLHGAAERASSSADATARAAKNPVEALEDAGSKFVSGLKMVIVAVIVVLVLALMLTRGRA